MTHTAGVFDTGSKFTAGIVDTGGAPFFANRRISENFWKNLK
jgi:hypothetical protein